MFKKLAIGGAIAALVAASACGSQSEKERQRAEMAEINKIYEEGMAGIETMTGNASAELNANAAASESKTAATDSLGAGPEGQ